MEESTGTRGQMSEAISTGTFLTLSGGSRDAYTYRCRGNVFANAQAGNIVPMGSHLVAGEWNVAPWHLAPVLAFAGGVYMAKYVKRLHRQDRRSHWRQLIVAIEIILPLVMGFLSQDMDMTVSITVSFACALQVNAFGKTRESPYATTICIGNLRSATENLYQYRHTGQKDHRDKYIRYYGVTGIFAVGVVMSNAPAAYLRKRIIWVSCGLLLVSFLIMFVKEDVEGGHV